MIKIFLSIIFVCAAFSMEKASTLDKRTPLYENNIVSLPTQDFFRGPNGYVKIEFDVVDADLLRYYATNLFQLVKRVDGKSMKPFSFAQCWFNLQQSGDNKVTVSIPLMEDEAGEYDLYEASSFSIKNLQDKPAKWLCTISVKTEPKSIGDALLEISHYDLKVMNQSLESYKKVYGVEWSKIKLLAQDGVSDSNKEYVLDYIMARGQDGTVLKMVPANNEVGDPIILKTWRDITKWTGDDDPDDTRKINNEIKMRRNFPPELVAPFFGDKELKISGVRALAMPFIKGKTLAEIIDNPEVLLSYDDYQKIINQLEGLQSTLELIEDFNSGNVIVEEKGMRLRLIDFTQGFRQNDFDKGKQRFSYIMGAVKKKQSEVVRK